jgi:hypothetical protein
MAGLPGTGWVGTRPKRGYALNPAHPLNHGLLLDLLFHEGTGTQVFDLTRTLSGPLTGGVAWDAGDDGPCLTLDGSTGYVPLPDLDPEYITILARVKVTTDGFILNKNFDGSTVPFSLNTTTGAGIYGGFAFYDGSWNNSSVSGALAGTGWRDIAGTFDGTNLRYYVDGALNSSSTVSARTLPTGNNNPVDLGRYANNAEYGAFSISRLRIVNRAYTAEEVLEFTRRPYAMIQGPQARRGFSFTAGGGGTPLALSGTLAGAGSLTGSLEVERVLSAALSGTGGLSGDAEVLRAFAAALSGSGSLAGTATVSRRLTDALSGAGFLAGDLSVVTEVLLSGVLAGSGALAGALEISREYAASLLGAAVAAGDLEVVRLLSGASAGVGSLSGVLLVEAAANGTHPPLTVTGLSLASFGRAGRVSGIGLATRGRLVPVVVVEYVPPPRIVRGWGRVLQPSGSGRTRQPTGAGRTRQPAGSGKVY